MVAGPEGDDWGLPEHAEEPDPGWLGSQGGGDEGTEGAGGHLVRGDGAGGHREGDGLLGVLAGVLEEGMVDGAPGHAGRGFMSA